MYGCVSNIRNYSVKMSEDGVAAENRVETALINDLDPEAISAVAARSRKNVITYIYLSYLFIT